MAACVLGAVASAACAREPDRAAVGGADTSAVGGVVAEAKSFMNDYARELLAGDRAAIAARYDRSGTHLLLGGRKEFSTHEAIAARYAGSEWSPPVTFEWRDLTFEPAGPDAVVVAGQFLWGRAAGAPPITMSYTALLRRQDGVLRIRLENEAVVADPKATPPAAADTSSR